MAFQKDRLLNRKTFNMTINIVRPFAPDPDGLQADFAQRLRSDLVTNNY